MANISLEAGIRANLFSLSKTAGLMDQTQERLASGKKVNSIIDNPTSFFAARNLNDRAGQLRGRLDGMGQAISTINAATAGIDAIRSLLGNMRAIVNDAISNGTASERQELGDQYNTVLEEAFKIAGDSGYQGVNLLTSNQTMMIDFAEGNGDSQLNLTGLDVQGQGTNGVSGITTSETVTRSSVATAGAVAAVTSQAEFASQASVASVGSNASVSSVASAVSTASIASAALQTSMGAVGTSMSQSSMGATTSAASSASVASAASIASAAVSATVGTVASQQSIASRASAASVASAGSVTATYDQSYAFTLQTSDSDDTIGIRKHGSNPSGSNGNHRINFGSTKYIDELNALTKEIDAYDTALQTQNARLATNLNVVTVRQEFTESLVNELEGGADKLTLADMNEEGANLLSLQTRQSLAIQALSLTAQSSQQILRLLA